MKVDFVAQIKKSKGDNQDIAQTELKNSSVYRLS